MENKLVNTNLNQQAVFDFDVYRSKNQDLRNLTSEELIEHFKLHGSKEPRPFAYCHTTVDRLSMKYLRGEGLEIGAGENPTPLFGETSCLYADISENTVFGSTNNNRIIFDINHPKPLLKTFDFVIASHVLEHVDSLARSLSAIGRLLKKDGIAYIILPDIKKDADQFWMQKFSIFHHIVEKFWPTAFRSQHEKDFCRGIGDMDVTIGWGPIQQKFPEDLKKDLRKGQVTPIYRYIYHRHSYNFNDWTRLLLFLLKITYPRLTLIDSAVGDERSDCHFIFKRETI